MGKRRSLREIVGMDSPALTAVIDYWKDYDTSSPLLAYAELKRRNYSLDKKLLKRIEEFLVKNNSTDIESLLNNSLNESGYSSYEECLEKEIGFQKKEVENITKINISSTSADTNNEYEKKYPALRTISVVYQAFGYLMMFAVVIIAIILGQENITSAIIALIGGILTILGVFAVAELIKLFIDIEYNTRTKNK